MANRFWVGGTGTWDASDTTHWAASSGGAGGQSVPGSSDSVFLDGSSGGGTVTVNTTVNIVSLEMSNFTGTLDFATNNNNVTLTSNNPAFVSSGSATRTLNMGNGTWTIRNGGIANQLANVIDMFNNANFTLNCNSSSLVITSTGAVVGPRGITGPGVAGSTITFNNITITEATVSGFPFVWNTGGSSPVTVACANLTLGNTRQLLWPRGHAVLSVSGALTVSGTALNDMASLIGGIGSAGNSTTTISVAGANTLNYAFLSGILKSGAGSITANNSVNGGGNSGITINTPSGGAGAGNPIGLVGAM